MAPFAWVCSYLQKIKCGVLEFWAGKTAFSFSGLGEK